MRGDKHNVCLPGEAQKEETMNNLTNVVVGLAEAGFPYMSVDAIIGKGYTLFTEIRVGGRKCKDGYIKDISSLDNRDIWTGHFYGIRFTACTENVVWLISNAYDLAYCHHLKGKRLSDREINSLRAAC